MLRRRGGAIQSDLPAEISVAHAFGQKQITTIALIANASVLICH
jgi:hypothetical protein